MVLGEPAFEVRAGVDAGRGVSLEEDLVAGLPAVLAAEEVVEPDLVEYVGDRFVLQRAPSAQWYGARRARLGGMENDPRRRRSRGGRRRGGAGGPERGRPTRTPAEPKAAPPARGLARRDRAPRRR